MDTLLSVGLSNAVVAGGLALAVAIFGRVCRRPALLHGLWLLVLVKLITPPIWPIALGWPAPWIAATVDTDRAAPSAGSPDVSDDLDSTEGAPLGAAQSVPADPFHGVPVQTGIERLSSSVADRHSLPAVLPQGPHGNLALVTSWATGSLLWWVLAGLRMGRFRRLLRYGRPAPSEVQDRARRLAGRLGLARCPGVWFLPAPVSPMIWASGTSPRLLIPAALWDRLAGAQQETLLVHELAHLRRRDHWVRVLEFVVLGLYWWHPAVWWARREIRDAEEECCDAWVIWALPAASPVYAAALVETVAFLSQSRCPLPLTASGIGHIRPLRRRLIMIMRGTTPRSLSAAGFLSVLGLGALLLPLLPTWAQTEARREGAEEKKVARQADEKRSTPKDAVPSTAGTPIDTAKAAESKDTAPGKAATTPPPGQAPDLARREGAQQIEEARDEVELIKAQLDVTRAHLEAAERGLAHAEQRYTRLKELHLRGAVNAERLEQALQEVETQSSQLRIRRAEVKEPELRLRRAQRRLAALENQSEQLRRLRQAGPKAIGKTPADLGSVWGEVYHDTNEKLLRETRDAGLKRGEKQPDYVPADSGEKSKLLELEKKLDTLLKEMESLRWELKPPRPYVEYPPSHDANEVITRRADVKIPFAIDPQVRTKVKEIVLFSSTDQGRTWQQVATATPDQLAFTYRAPADGLYWFTVGIVDQQGKLEPADMTKAWPTLKLKVDTRKPDSNAGHAK